jgi:hypothetical protein
MGRTDNIMNLSIDALGVNLIDGNWIAHDGQSVIQVRNPASLDIIGIVPDLGAREAMLAVAAVQRAAPGWSATTAVERESILLHAAELMQTHRTILRALLRLSRVNRLLNHLVKSTMGSISSAGMPLKAAGCMVKSYPLPTRQNGCWCFANRSV